MKRIKAKHIIRLEVLLLFVLIASGFWQLGRRNYNASSGNAKAQNSENSGAATKTEDMEHSEEKTEDKAEAEKKDYIKYVEFKVTAEAMKRAYEYDVETYGSKKHLNWIDLLSYLGTRYGGDFKRYKASDMDTLAEQLKNGETDMKSLTKDLKYFPYYKEAYTAVLGGMVGEYKVQAPEASGKKSWEKKYGLKAYHPIAKNFPYSEFDDFGVSRSYGYRRNHLGHDFMGQTGTPVICVESGYVEAMGWNQYGGWRLGIRSFDGKRYYYYAHLRQDFPYTKSLKEGSVVTAGDVVGYMGRTGYSTKENTSNIDTPHLHFGLQLIFDESQKEGIHEIWVSCYELSRFLYKNRSETKRIDETKEWARITAIEDPAVSAFKKKSK